MIEVEAGEGVFCSYIVMVGVYYLVAHVREVGVFVFRYILRGRRRRRKWSRS